MPKSWQSIRRGAVASDRARERTIVRHGYTIFRFTGSEVIRNPRQCVQEVISLLKSAAQQGR